MKNKIALISFLLSISFIFLFPLIVTIGLINSYYKTLDFILIILLISVYLLPGVGLILGIYSLIKHKSWKLFAILSIIISLIYYLLTAISFIRFFYLDPHLGIIP